MNKEKVTYHHFLTDPLEGINPDDSTKGAEEVLRWAYDHYGSDIVYACSFGAEGVVLIDLIAKTKPDAEVVFLDTGLHFQETYQLIERVKQRYPRLQIRMKKPSITVEEQGEKHGSALWKRDPDKCCYIRKIKPLEEVLSGVGAWVSGLRREQSPSRSRTNFINKDERFKSIKVCPLIHWTWDDVWQYIRLNSLEYNELHDQNYPSVGCIPCTTQSTGEGRSGRWNGFNKTECGLHTSGND